MKGADFLNIVDENGDVILGNSTLTEGAARRAAQDLAISWAVAMNDGHFLYKLIEDVSRTIWHLTEWECAVRCQIMKEDSIGTRIHRVRILENLLSQAIEDLERVHIQSKYDNF